MLDRDDQNFVGYDQQRPSNRSLDLYWFWDHSAFHVKENKCCWTLWFFILFMSPQFHQQTLRSIAHVVNVLPRTMITYWPLPLWECFIWQRVWSQIQISCKHLISANTKSITGFGFLQLGKLRPSEYDCLTWHFNAVVVLDRLGKCSYCMTAVLTNFLEIWKLSHWLNISAAFGFGQQIKHLLAVI